MHDDPIWRLGALALQGGGSPPVAATLLVVAALQILRTGLALEDAVKELRVSIDQAEAIYRSEAGAGHKVH